MLPIEINKTHNSSIPVNMLSNELYSEVFSYLNFANLKVVAKVCSRWQQVGIDAVLWKEVAFGKYQKMVFDCLKWTHFFGEGCIKKEEFVKEFFSLPTNIYEILERSDSRFIGKNESTSAHEQIGDTHILVRIPIHVYGERFTLKNFQSLTDRHLPDIKLYRNIWTDINETYGDKPLNKSCWVLMTKDILRISRDTSFLEQERIVANFAGKIGVPYKVPTLLELVVCLITTYIETKIRLFSDGEKRTYTSCEEKTELHQVYVGGFNQDGFAIDGYSGKYEEIGVAAMWKF